MLGLVGALLSLGLLIWLAYRGWNVIALSVGCALLAGLFAAVPLLATYTQVFMPATGAFSKREAEQSSQRDICRPVAPRCLARRLQVIERRQHRSVAPVDAYWLSATACSRITALPEPCFTSVSVSRRRPSV
jgi:hypothetical protein